MVTHAATWSINNNNNIPSSPPQYDKRLCEYLDEYDTALLVHADNVGSKQFMDIRRVRVLLLLLFDALGSTVMASHPPPPHPSHNNPHRLCVSWKAQC